MLIADLPSLCSVSIGDESFWSCETVAMISTLGPDSSLDLSALESVLLGQSALYGRHRASGKNSDSENVLVMRGWLKEWSYQRSSQADVAHRRL